MPTLVHAPLYAPAMGCWYMTGDLAKIHEDYPYGFRRPFEQQGTLIAIARVAGLILALACVAALGREVARATGSRLEAFLALWLCVATGPESVSKFRATKPDFIMLALLYYKSSYMQGLSPTG